MNYYLDSEFKEAFHTPMFGKKRHYIDLISIALVAEDGREYYAISNEFDLKEIWYNKDTWLKENVLKPIHSHLAGLQPVYVKTYYYNLYESFSYKSLKNLIQWHGKENSIIANEILNFVNPHWKNPLPYGGLEELIKKHDIRHVNNALMSGEYAHPTFYGYFSDYDWVLLCSLYGRMLNLPPGFPMYCRDLKQELEDLSILKMLYGKRQKFGLTGDEKPQEVIKKLKLHETYPKQTGEHNALDDAKWNQRLHAFIKENYNSFLAFTY